jgi:hypothetical protein
MLYPLSYGGLGCECSSDAHCRSDVAVHTSATCAGAAVRAEAYREVDERLSGRPVTGFSG